jgi:ABC-type glycerol-3-phosphate transport system permease component
MSIKRRQQLQGWALAVLLVPVTAVALFPFYWTVLSSLKSPSEILQIPLTFVPQNMTLENYRVVIFERPSLRSLGNSLIVAVAASLIGLAIAGLGAYALARFRFRGQKFISLFILFTQMFPLAVLIVPLFIVWRTVHLTNTLPGLIGVNVAVTLPLGLWLLRAYYSSIPEELEDAARVDGCTYFGVFWRIILPLSLPGLISVFIYCFTVCWQEYLFAITFISSDALKTLPLVLNSFANERGTDWGGMMAASVLMTVPVAAIYLLLQRYFLTGLTAGAVKA